MLENISEAQSLVPTCLIGQIHLRRILLFLVLIFFIGRVIQLGAEPLKEKEEGSTREGDTYAYKDVVGPEQNVVAPGKHPRKFKREVHQHR